MTGKKTSRTHKKREVWIHLAVGAFLVLTFFPFVFMLFTSLKSNEQFFQNFWGPASPAEWSNYAQAWSAIGHYVYNSIVVSALSVSGVLVVASLSAYAFARHKFPGSQIFFYAILALMMVPGVLTLISSFMWMKSFPFMGGNNWLGDGGSGLLNTHAALVLPYIAGGQVFAIFILRSFISGLPEELFEAARLDGASELATLRSLVLPLMKPILGTIAIMNLLSVWNDYIWPLIVISDEAKKTLTIGLAFFQGAYFTTYGPLMAGYVIACLPLLILFLFAMRYFIEGLTSGAIKA